jgi:hypothetical protein
MLVKMLLEELHKHYKTWTNLSRELGFGVNTYQKWRNRGGIPYTTQLLIEKRTKGKFKAREEDAIPKE